MKKKLLYASPLLPMKSGISDYSEVLICGLNKYFDITLLIDNYKLANKKLYEDFDIKILKKDKINFEKFDYKIYNLGNNPYYHLYMYECALNYPGMVILHDHVLYFLVIGYYQDKTNFYSKIYELSGAYGISLLKKPIKERKPPLDCKELASLLPLNKEIIDLSTGVIVHSECTKTRIEREFPHAKVFKIDMIDMNKISQIENNDYLKKKYNISDHAVVIASFGYILFTKLNDIICEVINEINQSSSIKIYYIMAGEGDYINHYLNKNIIKTGFVEREVYDSILKRCDIVASLRYPSMGETSISLIHAMGLGKPCIVSNDAWFSELPDDVVIKINNQRIKEQLREKIIYLLNNKDKLSNISKKAKDYVCTNHSTNKVSHDIYEILENNKDKI